VSYKVRISEKQKSELCDKNLQLPFYLLFSGGIKSSFHSYHSNTYSLNKINTVATHFNLKCKVRFQHLYGVI